MFNWFNFILYALITSITPGPNNIMSMSNGKRLGIRKSISFNFGVGIGVCMLLFLSAWLASTVSAFLPKLSFPMKILGATYMLYLAFKVFKSKGELKENYRKTSLLIGAMLQFINPKAYLYSIVTMEMYILPYYNTPHTIIMFAILLSSISVLCTICWTCFGSLLEKLFSKYARITNTIMALLLAYCALSLFL